MAELSLRIVAAHEAPALVALVAAFRNHLGESEPTEADLVRRVPVALADPAIEFACAWRDERALGYTQTQFTTSVWVPGTDAFLEDLYVLPDARRQSVGRALLRFAIARAEERGAVRFALNTNEANVEAQGLYRSEGLAPKSHARFEGGREVAWSRKLIRS